MYGGLFHDAGFLETYNNHEEASCNIARRCLPQFDYSDEEIEEVCKLIMVTKLPQRPASKLEYILCDADLFYLGTDTYFYTSKKLFDELKAVHLIKNNKQWYNLQVNFLHSHRYFTKVLSAKMA
jgi:hypothetical protein